MIITPRLQTPLVSHRNIRLESALPFRKGRKQKYISHQLNINNIRLKSCRERHKPKSEKFTVNYVKTREMN